jgi:CxxC motif-containing protein
MTATRARPTPSVDRPAGPVETSVYLCIQCPIGCRLEVDAVDGDIIEVRGASCTHGERYARQEHVDPRRSVSTTVATIGATVARLPVRTAEAVPKAAALDVARACRSVAVRAPVRRGDVVLDDVLGLGVPVIATRTLVATEDAEKGLRHSPEGGRRSMLDVSGTSSDVPGTPPGERGAR